MPILLISPRRLTLALVLTFLLLAGCLQVESRTVVEDKPDDEVPDEHVPDYDGPDDILPDDVSENAIPIHIASFNIKVFGKTKASNASVMQSLAEIVRMYDVVAVQEIKDIDQEVPYQFLDLLNENGSHYGMLLSQRTGLQDDDSSSQEQYAIYYDNRTIEVLDEGGLFNDSADDLFQREPFLARLGVRNSTLDFVLGVIHTKPAAAVEEIDALAEVFDWSAARFPGEDDILIVGDYNADCSYADEYDELRNLEIRSDNFTWVIPDWADTNLASSSCTYDRMVFSGDLDGAYDGKWGVHRAFYDNAVSDHWPVWMELIVEIN